ncbi:MAG: ParA family protein [Deltaproteobacteria bacterium]|nr:MAG: ParA family protein [Deltaproteobacteria bacterium]
MRNLLKTGLRRLAGASTVRRPVGDHTATVLAIATQKGGVGKTTTSVNLASALARYHGKKVLLLDLDPQGHVARALQAQINPGKGGLSDVLLDESGEREVLDVVTRTEIPGLSVTPADPGLRVTEDLLTSRIGKEFLLRDALKVTRTWYDFILIDCPPNLGNLSINGLVAADQVLIPCDPSPLALSGVEGLVNTIEQVAGRLNPEIDVLGILLTRVDGRNSKLNAAVDQEIAGRWGDAVLPVRIGVNSSLAQAQQEGRDIYSFDPDSRGARQYRDLAEHLVQAVQGSGLSPA